MSDALIRIERTDEIFGATVDYAVRVELTPTRLTWTDIAGTEWHAPLRDGAWPPTLIRIDWPREPADDATRPDPGLSTPQSEEDPAHAVARIQRVADMLFPDD